MKRCATVVLVALLVVSGGCLESEIELAVKKDASGVITETVYLGPAMLEMGAAMGGKAPADGGDGDGVHPMLKRMADKNRLAQQAAKMGEGVTLRDVQIKKTADGKQGYVATYDVKDVNKLGLSMNPSAAGGRRRRGGAGQDAAKSKIQIQYKPGASALTVLIPEVKQPARGEAKPPVKLTEEQKQQFAMMAPMFEGMKIAVRLTVPGTITKTNAQYVNEKKTGITLVEMNIGAMMQDEKLTEKLQAMGRITDVAAARGKLNDPAMKKYVKFELGPKVEIEFK